MHKEKINPFFIIWLKMSGYRQAATLLFMKNRQDPQKTLGVSLPIISCQFF
jgi:hypothetical protein